MFCDMNFMYRLYHDCARTLKRSLLGKLAIVELSGDFGFARNSSKHPCTLTSFSRACMPRSGCTCSVTCELYCINLEINTAQRLLNAQFTDIIGLKSTLLQELLVKPFHHCIQIIHCKERDRLIAATAICWESGAIKMC